MPPRTRLSDRDSPREQFISAFRDTLESKGTIELPKSSVDAMRQALPDRMSGPPVDPEIIHELVTLIDEHEDACSQFDGTVFGLVLRICLQSEYSRDKERGLYLLAESLSHEPHGQQQEDFMNEKKVVVGYAFLQPLITCCVNENEHARIRCVVGLLIIGLLHDTVENTETFAVSPEIPRRRIGRLVIYERDEILRIVYGKLVQATMKFLDSVQHLWPSTQPSGYYSSFPAASQPDTAWINSFQKHIDGVYSQYNIESPAENVYFIQAVHIPGHDVQFSKRTIAVTVNAKKVSIYALRNSSAFDEFLDIPWNLIAKIGIEEAELEKDDRIKEQPIKLIFELRRRSKDKSFYINGCPLQAKQIEFTISDLRTAKVIEQEVLNPKPEEIVESASQKEGVSIRKQKASQSKSPIRLSGDSANDHLESDSAVQETKSRKSISRPQAKMSQKNQAVTATKTRAENNYDRTWDIPESQMMENGSNRRNININLSSHNQGRPNRSEANNDDDIRSDLDELHENENETNTGPSAKTVNQPHLDMSATNAKAKEAHTNKNVSKKKGNDDESPHAKSSRIISRTHKPSTSEMTEQSSEDKPSSEQENSLRSPRPATKEAIEESKKSKLKLKQYNIKAKPRIGTQRAAVTTIAKDSEHAEPSEISGSNDEQQFLKDRKGHIASKQKVHANEGRLGQKAELQLKSRRRPSENKSSTAIETEPTLPRRKREAAKKANIKLKAMSSDDEGPANLEDAVVSDAPAQIVSRRVTSKLKVTMNGIAKPSQADDIDPFTNEQSLGRQPNVTREIMQEVVEESHEVVDYPLPNQDLESDRIDPLNERNKVNNQHFEDAMVYQNADQNIDPVQPTLQLANGLTSILDEIEDHPSHPDGFVHNTQGHQRSRQVPLSSKNDRPNASEISSAVGRITVNHGPPSRFAKQKSSKIHSNIQPEEHEIKARSSGEKRKANDECVISEPEPEPTNNPRKVSEPEGSNEDVRKPKRAKLVSTLKSDDEAEPNTPSSSPGAAEKSREATKRPPRTRRMKSTSPPPRRSPRILARAQSPIAPLQEVPTHSTDLLDDRLARKTPMVGFSKEGPLNQGHSSARNLPAKNLQHDIKPDEHTTLVEFFEPDQAEQFPLENHAKLRRAKDEKDNAAQQVQILPPRSSRNVIVDEHPSELSSSRTSSQQSQAQKKHRKFTITAEGSPLSTVVSQVNNVRPTEQRTLDAQIYQNEGEGSGSEPMYPDFGEYADELPTLLNDDDGENNNGNGNAIYNNVKAQPSSPNDFTTQYIPHRKTKSGRYVNITADQVVSPNDTEPDLFPHGKTKKRFANFIERLQAANLEESIESMKPKLLETKSRMEGGQMQDDPDKTLVEAEPPAEEVSVGSEMQYNEEMASVPSNDEDNRRRLEEEWKTALKPHQMTMLDTLYQISNDLIRLLVEPEEGIYVIADDYLRNGNKLLQRLESEHKEERLDFQRNALKLTGGLTRLYKESHTYLQQQSKSTKSSSINSLRRDWAQQRNEVRKLVNQASTVETKNQVHQQQLEEKGRKKHRPSRVV